MRVEVEVERLFGELAKSGRESYILFFFSFLFVVGWMGLWRVCMGSWNVDGCCFDLFVFLPLLFV